MRKAAIWLGVILVFIGGGLAASSIIMQPPAREALPVVSGTVVEAWRYVRRSGTDMRIQIAPAEGAPHTFWMPQNVVQPGVLAALRGRPATLRHASTGEVMELIVEGRPVVDYARAANKRSAALLNNRWIGFGVFMAGVTLASLGLVLGR